MAHNIQLVNTREMVAQGQQQWSPLQTYTLKQWLESQIQTAILLGEIPAANVPSRTLDAMEERLLWERVIEESLANDVMKDLFDSSGLASAAAEANALMQVWNIPPASLLVATQTTEETKQFLQWRRAFQKACSQAGWLESVRYFDWQIERLAKLELALPSTIDLAGFDRIDPQQQRLLDVLMARGVQVNIWQIKPEITPNPVQCKLDNRDAEYRAAVAWAVNALHDNPQARLAIVVPELAVLRERLASLLDDYLHPVSIEASHAEMPRLYDFSLGQPLSKQPVIAVALNLLRLCAGRHDVAQEQFSPLLLQRFWSADISEANARAKFDALLRHKLPQTINLRRIIHFAEQAKIVPELALCLRSASTFLDQLPLRNFPSVWSSLLLQFLKTLGWPGERGLSSHEFQSQQKFLELVEGLSRLDALLGKVTLATIVQWLAQRCVDEIFQPRSMGDPPLQILGMLEAVGSALDGLWVMGMNDHIWPPQPRPNPLLPAALQRSIGTPNADSQVQSEFAQAIHQRLLHSASQIVFSWSEKEADRMLRTSPLIAALPLITDLPLASTLAEQYLPEQGFEPDAIDDHIAPALTAGEYVHGGTGLLKAQAICPAWAYYQYRLGARKLESPVDGLDSATRGNLVHMVLQQFWQGRDSVVLQEMSVEQRLYAVDMAATAALTQFNQERDQALSAAFIALEQQRLVKLVDAWLMLELTRLAPFSVAACEKKVELDIEGIAIRLFIDRIDALEDGRLVIIDYKTGAKPDYKNWAESRITEPQLPIYAALALLGDEVAAVCFSRVKSEEHAFSGIAAEAEILPKVNDITHKVIRNIFDEASFPDWPAVLEHWRTSIRAIASEIKVGEAAVRFNDEEDLKYCEVLPLLRLPERELQFERANALLTDGTTNA
ncbi:ATP-dependent helicase [Methyloradius palustris]|uniref:ATP-dependent helicase n=2 Tax=Methyloradius palustris TaxID=2778876 RepID=A0A8D5K0K3_9PROT|nr:ATP-dependent helicase [Methyloradius palustris]